MIRRWLAFAALCVLSASAWLLDEYLQMPLTGLLRQAIHATFPAALFLGFSRFHRKPVPARWPAIATSSAVLLAAPAIVLTAGAGHVSTFTSVLIFTLVPALTIFLTAQGGAAFGQDPNSLQLLTPALAAAAGAALLLPFALPSSAAGAVWLAADVGAAFACALAAIKLNSLLAGTPLFPSAAILSGATGLTCAAFAWLDFTRPALTGPGLVRELLVCLLVDAPILALTAWLLRSLTPTQFSTRYLLIPLGTVAEGVLLLRPTPTWIMLLGALLLGGGSAVLLRDQHPT